MNMLLKESYLFIFTGEYSIVRINNEGPANREGPRVNQEIASIKVRLVDENGNMVGVVTKNEALQMALRAGLDLVEVSPNAEPPVCKILDYGKYKYEQQKKKAEARKKQKVIEVKEIQMRPGIDENDFQVKLRAARRFLDEGNKVKISMRFRGREIAHHELGMQVLIRIREEFTETAKIELQPRLEGKQMIMVLAPGK
jgi:translation initiation factor IF-3